MCIKNNKNKNCKVTKVKNKKKNWHKTTSAFIIQMNYSQAIQFLLTTIVVERKKL